MNIKNILRKIFNFPRNKRLSRKILQLDQQLTIMGLVSDSKGLSPAERQNVVNRIPPVEQEIERLRKERNSLL